jgi:hypothetical protein
VRETQKLGKFDELDEGVGERYEKSKRLGIKLGGKLLFCDDDYGSVGRA